MDVYYTRRASRDLELLPFQIQKRVASKMRFFAGQPNPLGFAETLIDHREGDYRFRIGDYRVIFDVVGGKIYILKIKKRDNAYQ